jgi:protochlorophyllide reductase
MAKWTVTDIPDQTGRTVLITGANSGLGLHSARVLAAKGAKVLLACRDAERGRNALAQVAATARAEPELVELDLADLGSVHSAAADVRKRTGDALDVLMNNAGVMGTPKRRTKEGFELQIGTNHFGHAALTWLLMPALRERPAPRVVTLSSIAHHGNGLDIGDLNFEHRRYAPAKAYSQSKMANLLFALELDRIARRAHLDLVSVAAHPGMTDTELAVNSFRARSLPNALNRGVRLVNKLITQPVAQGVLPQLYAATAPDVVGGRYYGPDGFSEIRGHPKLARISKAAQDDRTAERLWVATAEVTGVTPDPWQSAQRFRTTAPDGVACGS